MSLTVTKISQAQAEWIKVFPKQATETHTGSAAFMKQLTTVAISTITYLKNVFSEDSYNVERFGGTSVRILKKKCNDELAQFVSTALIQAFEAFEKKYLQKLALCFYDGESYNAENLLEYHIFEYSYTESGVTMDVTSKAWDSAKKSLQYTFEHVRDKTIKMIRSCMVMINGCSTEIPASFDISLRLYYNDAAPEGYQAPGFLSALESDDHIAGTSGGAVAVGAVHTPFHRLVASSYMRDQMHSSHDAEPSQNAPKLTQLEGEDFDSAMSELMREASSCAGRVRCPCDKVDEDGELMLTCDSCGSRQHAACFGRTRAPPAHCCARCADARPGARGKDLRLHTLSDKKRECLCILRRTLAWCRARATLAVAALAARFALTHDNAARLLALLQSYGVFEDADANDDIMAPRKILPDRLKVLMSKYFYAEESDLVDRLVTETQETPVLSDPVGDVLEPMEKVSLHNATTLGTIIEPPAQDSVMEDASLQQYKEAILSNQQIEANLPLSGDHNPVKDMDMIGKKNGKRKAGKENLTGVKTKRAKKTISK